MLSTNRQTDTWASFGLAFVGGFGDAGQLRPRKDIYWTRDRQFGANGNCCSGSRLAGCAGTSLGHRHFLARDFIECAYRGSLKARPSLPAIMGIEVILIVAASLALPSHTAHGVELFVIFASLALGLQNGAFRRAGGISVHTTYLTGMLTSLISTETGRYASETVPPAVRAPDPKIGLLCGIWIAFVLGAGTGAAMVFRFKALGMFGAAVLLSLLILCEVQS